MYSHKLSPPIQPSTTPRTSMSSIDMGFSSAHYRTRGERENGRVSASESETERSSRPATPPDPAAAHTSASSASSPSSASSLAALFGMKKGRLLYSQSDSPKGRKKGRGLLGGLLDSKHSQLLFIASVAVNVVLLIIVFMSFSGSSPLCLSNPLQHADIAEVEHSAVQKHEPPAVVTPPPIDTRLTDDTTQTVVEPAPPQPVPSPDPLFADDLSNNDYSVEAHSVTWSHCLAPSTHVLTFGYDELANLSASPLNFPSTHCPATPTVEQSWQIGWYGGQVAVGGGSERNFPLPQKCVHLPPDGYVWPARYTDLPAADQRFLNWPNLRVEKYEDLIIFNQGTPKNLYHFNAPQYDLDGLDELSLGARYIPFKNKIRNFLDIGAGGGSLGLLLKRKYGVEAMSIIFPDWPYCEYITERGGLCVLVDVMEAMPFARASFDAVHISWVYHGQQPAELIQMYTEIDRIVRPGGYVWQRGGWSLVQINAQKALFASLGYVQLYENLLLKPEDITKRISFGPNLPFEAEWTCVYVKPIRAVKQAGCDSAPDLVTIAAGA